MNSVTKVNISKSAPVPDTDDAKWIDAEPWRAINPQQREISEGEAFILEGQSEAAA